MQAKTRPPGGRVAARVGVTLGLVAAGLVATATPSFALADTMTPSVTHGPSGGGYNIQLTPTVSTTFTTGASGTLVAQFQKGACDTGLTPPAQTPIISASNAVSAGIVTTATPAAATSPVTDLVIAVPAAVALPADASTGSLSICVYDSTGLIAGTATNAFKIDPVLTPTPISGATGGGFTMEVVADHPVFTAFNTTNFSVQFQAKTVAAPLCAAASMGATTPSASAGPLLAGGVVPITTFQVPTTTKLTFTVPTTLIQPTNPMLLTADYNICAYATAGGALIAETSPTTTFNVNGNAALSANSGSTAGGNTITLTASGAIFTAGTTYYGQLQDASSHPNCDAFYASSGSPVNPSQTRFISTLKAALTLPTTIAAKAYNVCVYDSNAGSGTHLVAQGNGYYTTGVVPTVISVSPATGPAQGGSTITVTGTLFPTAPGALSATVGGSELQIVGAVTATAFTAITPPHAPANNLTIAVTTSGGTVEGKNLFTYTNGITVAPNTAPNSKATGTDLDITGVGFEDLTFAAAGTYDQNSTNAHVYLVKGAYSPVALGTAKTNGQTAECADVLVVSDTNLICTLYTMGNGPLPANAARSMTGCTGTSAASVLVLGGSCAFSAADVGLTISGTGFGAASTITAVNASTGVPTLSKPLTANITGSGVINVYSATGTKALTDAAGSSSSKTLTTTTAMFAATDVGRAIYGANIPVGTVISAFTDTKTVTLSKALSSAQTAAASLAQPIFVYGSGAIPNGTYTVTVVSSGAVGASTVTVANPGAANFMQSIISSGATFTVADYN